MEPIIRHYCYAPIEAKYTQTLLGFRRYRCAACGKDSIYTLPRYYRNIYRGVIVIVGAITFFSLLEGRIAIPGLLCIIGIVGLIQDQKVKRHVDSTSATFLQKQAQKDIAP